MRFCKPICICIVVFVAVQMPSGLQIHCTNVILKANKHVHCILFEVQTPIGGLPNSQHKCDFVVCTVFIPLRISGDGAPKWFCREKGSTEHKSIQESASKCTTKMEVYGTQNGCPLQYTKRETVKTHDKLVFYKIDFIDFKRNARSRRRTCPKQPLWDMFNPVDKVEVWTGDPALAREVTAPLFCGENDHRNLFSHLYRKKIAHLPCKFSTCVLQNFHMRTVKVLGVPWKKTII